LGIKEGHRVALINAPKAFDKTLGSLPTGAAIVLGSRPQTPIRSAKLGKTPFDVLVCFVTARKDFENGLAAWRGAMTQAGGLWIAWPKKASGVATDMTEDVVREVALPTGLVDNKVCAIDETWSGLRLVIRKELRK
jgi:hypothetical protein